MCRETALLLLAVVGGVVRSLVRIPKGGWVVLIGVPSSGQPFSALLAFHGGCLVTDAALRPRHRPQSRWLRRQRHPNDMSMGKP